MQSAPAVLALVLLFAWCPRAAGAQSTSALHRITGTVVDARSEAPLPLADVVLGGTSVRVLTDARGQFRIDDVPEGDHLVGASRLGYASDSTTVVVAADVDLRIALDPAPVPLAAIVVTPGFFGVMGETMASGQALDRERIESAPQLGEDVYRSVARIPGVSASDLSAAFGIRGSRPSEVLVMLDGLELYEPFHLKDFDNALSILDLAAMGGVDLMTGGFGAQYGDRIGGVFDVRSMAVAPGDARTQLALSVTALRAGSRGSFADGRGRWLASARRGYLEIALKLVGDDDDFGAPTYHDVFGKVEYALGRGTLSANVLHAGDALDYESTNNDPHVQSRYGSSYGWLTWRAPFGRTLSQTTTAAAGRLTWNRFTGEGPGRRALPLGVTDRRSFDFVALRQDWMQEWSEWTLTRAGAHLRRLSADYDYEGWRQRDFAEDGSVVRWTDSTRLDLAPSGLAVDAWALQRVRVLPSLVAEAGVHYSRREHTGDEIWAPRVNLAFSPRARTTLRGSWGLHAQSHGIHELAAVDGEDAFQPAERSEQLGIGLEQAIPGGVVLRVEAYDRRLTDLRPRWVNLDSPDDMFAELARTRVRIDPTEGRSRGIELSATRQVPRGLSASASYVLSRVTERIDGREVPRARDQRHALGVDVAWAPDDRWRVSAAWQYRSGWPRTSHEYEIERLRDGRPYIHWSYGPYNDDRLPSYHRLDTRLTRHIDAGSGRVSIYLDVFNVYDRMNPRSIILYASVNSRGQVVRRERTERLLPRLPSLGVVWEF